MRPESEAQAEQRRTLLDPVVQNGQRASAQLAVAGSIARPS
jgi:hypothetical protein